MADEVKKEPLPEGNSLEERAARKRDIPEKTKTQVTRVVPEKKKEDKSFVQKTEEFFDPIVNDVLIPSAQDTIMDVVNSILSGIGNSICEAITGQPMKRDISVRVSRNRRNGRTDYNAASRRDNGSPRRSIQDNRDQIKETTYIKDLYVNSHTDAVNVIDQLYQILDAYGRVSCNELYGLEEIGKSCPYTYVNYGWYDLKDAGIINNGDGTWGFDLPKPVVLNR